MINHNLLHSIPNLSELRKNKPGYDSRYTIDQNHPLHNDPLVDLREPDFGFYDASSYYSKPNDMTGKILPGVPDTPLIRLDIARRLVLAEKFLNSDPDVKEVLGAPAHLRIDDALRPYQVQKFAFNIAWPMIIKTINPEMSYEEVLAQVPNYCARPNTNLTPTPHLTGGAVDVALVNLETGQAFNRGHQGGGVKGTAYPDFYENYQNTPGQSDITDSVDKLKISPEEQK